MSFQSQRNSKYRILFVTCRPIGKSGGANQRQQGLLTALTQYYDVETFIVNDELRTVVPEGLARRRTTRFSVFSLTPRWVRKGITRHVRNLLIGRLTDEVKRFDADLVIFSGPEALPWITKLDVRSVILDAYDIMWIMMKRKDMGGQPRLRARIRATLEGQIARLYERRKYALADEVWVCSEMDMDYVRENGWRKHLRTVPNFFVLPTAQTTVQSPCRNAILFVGSMGYHANVDGIRWFLRYCWKSIRDQLPQAKFRIAGAWNNTTDLREFEHDGVEILGYVEDLSALWQASDVFICPLNLGTGTRIKIIEAWSRRLPVVSTSIGIEGLAAIPGVHALVQDEPEKFVELIVCLLQNDALRAQIGEAGFQLMQSLYTLERVGALAAGYCWEILSE